MCGATQCKPNRSKSTAHAFDRGGVFVAACSTWSHAHTRTQLSAMQHESSSQRVGALLIHRPAWVDQHTGGSRLTPTVHPCPKGMAVGGPGDQTAQYSAETPQTWWRSNVDPGQELQQDPREPRRPIQCEMSDLRRRMSTEVRNAKTLTIVVRVRCFARRREPTQPIDMKKRA